MHPKTADGVDSLQPDIVGAAVEAVRHAAPGLPLGVTTGFWALPDPDERLRAVEAWTVLPDFASVNWHEPGSDRLARLLLSMGLGVEVGIYHAEAAASWARSEMAAHCMRVMVELGPDGDVATADDLLGEVLAAGSPAPVLLHGLNESCWPLLEHAAVRGVQARIGMEDTLLLPDGSTAPGTPRWCRRRCSCSVGRSGQREVGVVESGYDDTADQRGFVVARAGPLPVPGGTARCGCSPAVMSPPSRCVAALACSGPNCSNSGLPRW